MYMSHLVSFIKETEYGHIPKETLDSIKIAFIDTIGVALAAEQEPVVRKLANAAPSFFHEQEEINPLHGNSTSFALQFGTMAHALDFDDNSITFQGHPSAVLVSTILGLAKELNSSGKKMIEAYAVGFEVLAKLSEVFVLQQYTRGWHTTATIGIFGAVAAAAKLLNLSEKEIYNAIGIAGSLSSGIQKNFGTMTKPLHVGFCSMHAIMATQLAAQGVTAHKNIFSDSMGIDGLMADMAGDFSPMTTLGHQWDLQDTGITIKRYPCCASTHRSIDATLYLVTEHSIAPEEIEEINVFVHHLIPSILVYPEPQNELEAKFSMPFCIAAAIHDGKVDLSTFPRFNEPNLVQLSRKVNMSVHPLQREGLEPRERFAEVQIKTRAEVYSKRVEFHKGHPRNPLSIDEVYEKFSQCLVGRMEQRQIELLFERLLSLEEQSVEDLLFWIKP